MYFLHTCPGYVNTRKGHAPGLNHPRESALSGRWDLICNQEDEQRFVIYRTHRMRTQGGASLFKFLPWQEQRHLRQKG